MSRLDGLSDDLVFRVAELFCNARELTELTTTEIAERVNVEFAKRQAPKLTRESVYEVVTVARERGFLRLSPTTEPELSRLLVESLRLDVGPERIHVVNVENAKSNSFVAAASAELVYELVLGLKKEGGPVRSPDPRAARGTTPVGDPMAIGLGLGPGRATHDFSAHLGELFRNSDQEIKLRLTSIAAGCPASEPQHATTSYFALFPSSCTTARIGLFAKTLMTARDFRLARDEGRKGIGEAFDERYQDRIDLIVTSMGDFTDKHDLLRRFMLDAHEIPPEEWPGSVQYRPFTAKGPYHETDDELRAVTLFELEDFVTFATRPRKRVVLISRRCGKCKEIHDKALLPLLTEPALRVWSDVVMDSPTALVLLSGARVRPADEVVQRSRTAARRLCASDLFTCATKTPARVVADEVNGQFAPGADTEFTDKLHYKLPPLPNLTREGVYQAVNTARREVFRLVPRLETTLAQRVASHYRLDPDSIRVVHSEDDASEDASHIAVATRAAEWVIELATALSARLRPGWDSRKLDPEHRVIGLGLGPGRASFDFCRGIGPLLARRADELKFKLVAIASGSPAYRPQFSSVNFFNLFPAKAVQERVGFFAETVMRQDDFDSEAFRTSTGVSEAFEQKRTDRLDIIVNSMGDLSDEHDLLRSFLPDLYNPADPDPDGPMGSVQFRPYTRTGPYIEKPGAFRAVTLYELSDFVDLARSKNKHVVLIARRCRECGKTKGRTLRPLLTVPELKVWSELVLDVPSARALLDD